MKRLILPLILLMVGLGSGVGAALFLASPPAADDAELSADGGSDTSAAPSAHAAFGASIPQEQAFDGGGRPILPGDRQYVSMSNQFIVPLLRDGNVRSLVILSISIEVSTGQSDAVRLLEPRLRDIFLQVLFDHANTGGFDGTFTAATPMRNLRASLLAAARNTLGAAILDVLIVDLVRQEV